MAAKKSPQQRLRWFAVRCDCARDVPKVGVRLARLGIHVFIPMHYVEEKQGKWMVAVKHGLLFPPYLFIAMRANGAWGDVTETDGVDRVMGGKNRNGDPVPAPIPYKVMRKIRTANRSGEKRLAAGRFQAGQKVKILSGPFLSFEGIFDKPAGERVRILTSLFGREVELMLPETDIAAA